MGFQILMITLCFSFVLLIGFVLLIACTHKKVPQGKALIRTGFGGAIVALDSGIFVLPILHKVEEIDLTLKHLIVEEEVWTKEATTSIVKASFYFRVSNDLNAILEVAQSIGCKETSTVQTIQELFYSKCIEALKIAAFEYTHKELRQHRRAFKEKILVTIGTNFNGYILDDCVVEQVKQLSPPPLTQSIFVLLDQNVPLKKGEKVIVVDKINDGKSYIVRRFSNSG